MENYTAIIEKCAETNLYVGHIPGIPGAHSQGETLEELHYNLHEVLEMLAEDGPLTPESQFIGTQLITVGS